MNNPKLRSLEGLKQIVSAKKSDGSRIVFANGCFDVLHVGHVRYLREARDQGDLLIVGLNSDESVRRLKGEGRPVLDQDHRAFLLAALECIDYILIF